MESAQAKAFVDNLYNEVHVHWERRINQGEFMTKLRAATNLPVAEGKFAAMMDVELVNNGPVTIILER